MQNGAVIRLIEGQLLWYPPGAGDAACALHDEGQAELLAAAMERPGFTAYFAAPGAELRLCELEVSAKERKLVEKSLPYMLEESLIADIEDLHFAASLRGKTHMEVIICARNKIRQWQALLAEFPQVKEWVPEPLLLPWKKGDWCIVFDAGMAIVRSGAFEGFSIERDMLPAMLDATLQQATQIPEAVVIYGCNQAEDTALLNDELRKVVQWRQGGMASALMLVEPPASGPNLLQGEFGVQLPLGRWWKAWRAVAAFIAVAFVVQLAATYTEFAGLEQENLALREAVESSYRKAYPRGALVDPEKQLARQLGALRGSTQTGGFVSLMSAVGDVLHAHPGTSIGSINYNDKSDEIRMNITARDFEAVENIRTALNSAGLNATMESSNAQGDKVRARLKVGTGS